MVADIRHLALSPSRPRQSDKTLHSATVNSVAQYSVFLHCRGRDSDSARCHISLIKLKFAYTVSYLNMSLTYINDQIPFSHMTLPGLKDKVRPTIWPFVQGIP